MLTPILIFVYLSILANNIESSIELKQHLKNQDTSYTSIAHKQLKLLDKLNLLSISRYSDSNRKLGYKISII